MTPHSDQTFTLRGSNATGGLFGQAHRIKTSFTLIFTVQANLSNKSPLISFYSRVAEAAERDFDLCAGAFAGLVVFGLPGWGGLPRQMCRGAVETGVNMKRDVFGIIVTTLIVLGVLTLLVALYGFWTIFVFIGSFVIYRYVFNERSGVRGGDHGGPDGD